MNNNQQPQKGIYIASKTKHADKWIALRDAGANIISTWIDEAGEGASMNLRDLYSRCVQESIACDAMIVYREEGDYLKGAFIEMGIALGAGRPIYFVGPVLPEGSVFTHSGRVFQKPNIESAIISINGCSPLPNQGESQERSVAVEDAHGTELRLPNSLPIAQVLELIRHCAENEFYYDGGKLRGNAPYSAPSTTVEEILTNFLNQQK